MSTFRLSSFPPAGTDACRSVTKKPYKCLRMSAFFRIFVLC